MKKSLQAQVKNLAHHQMRVVHENRLVLTYININRIWNTAPKSMNKKKEHGSHGSHG